MHIHYVKKRSGSIAKFDRVRIENAIKKACLATHTPVPDTQVSAMTDTVADELHSEYERSIPGVEDIQDIVERVIADNGLFEVAKAYILYRAQHEQIREAEHQKVVEKAQRHELKVLKRDGTVEPFYTDQIRSAVELVNDGTMSDETVQELVDATMLTIYDGISTRDINKSVLMGLKARIEQDPAYSFIAARFLFNDLYKDVLRIDESSEGFVLKYRKKFAQKLKQAVESGRLDARLLDFDLEKVSRAIMPLRDRNFAYLGAQTLYDRYFVKDLEQRTLEVPQYFWMRVAMGLAINEKNKEDRAIEFYTAMSELRYVPSTPTLFHSGTVHPQMSSCYLTTVEDDLDHIFKCIGDNAQLSKWSGGLGNDWSNIRGTGALIKSTNVGSQGVIPFLKIVDSTTAAINRSGKRRGALCAYLETWHYDIESFLELRKNTGDERRRTHEINTANWIPDLFMKRVQENGQWTLFSTDETPDLHHLYGRAFEQRYVEYEQMADEGKINLFKRMRAVDLWRKMITSLFETGHPWITFKDPANIRSPQDHVGVVHSSNLCTEITLNTSKDETAVCNLGSVNLPKHVKDGKLDRVLLQQTVATGMRMLDNVIDLNYYPTKEAKNANLKHRPVGLGVMGFQDVLYQVDLPFDSEQAVDLADELMEHISYHSILTSSALAKERGAYSSYKGSKWDRGIFPIDSLKLLEEERGQQTGVEYTSRLDWQPLRQHVTQYGMRNSNCLAIAPTATIANISGSLPSIEPIYKNLYVKSNVSGEFTVVNNFLVAALQQVGLWDGTMLDKIKYFDGSIQRINEIPADIRARYKEVFEIDPSWIVRHAAYRGKWIDQSQSVNIFTASESGSFIADVYMTAWKMGLKTTYYLRNMGATSIEKSTIDINKKFEPASVAAKPVPERVPVPVAAAPAVSSAKEDEECEVCQ